MIYAYRLKDKYSEKTGCVIEGFTVKGTWQFSSDSKVSVLKRWPKVVVLEGENIGSLKKDVDAFEKSEKSASHEKTEDEDSELSGFGNSSLDMDDPLVRELESKSFSELKDYAKANGFDESEYSKLTRSKLIEYIVLGMNSKKEDA